MNKFQNKNVALLVSDSPVMGNIDVVDNDINKLSYKTHCSSSCPQVLEQGIKSRNQSSSSSIDNDINPLDHKVKKGVNKSCGFKLPTPIHYDKLDLYLNGYDRLKRKYLIDGFKFGFRLNNFSLQHSDNDKTLKSATQFPNIVDKKLNKESQAGRILGPLVKPPFDKFMTSPLGLVPKKVPGEFRVIHHLSYPYGMSVNDGIDKQFATVQYSNISQAIKHILDIGRYCYLAKSDIQSAFRIIPINPIDYPLLGFKWKGFYYFDRCLPMGASSSCQIFESFSTALQWIVENYLPNTKVIHVLDDFLFIAKTESECKSSLRIFLRICEELGVPIALDKTFGPEQQLPFLGIQLDTVNMSSSLPADKIQKFLNIIEEFLNSKAVTLHKLQSLTGMLNFACQVIEPGRAFSRRLYNLAIGLSKPYHHVKITQEVKEDLLVWDSFLRNYNGRTFFLDYLWLNNSHLNLYTDAASTIGYGAIFGNKWLGGLWAPQCLRLNITLLELYPIVIALELWGDQLKNKCIQLNTDNMAVTFILNNFTSKDNSIMILVRRLVLNCINNNILIKAVHLPGRENLIPDLISRKQVPKALELAPFLNRTPDPIPDHLLLQTLLKI